jgi:hypothetical protein
MFPTLVTLFVLTVILGFNLVAYASAGEIPPELQVQAMWVGIGVNVGAFALVAWLFRHTFTQTIPRLVESFDNALALQRKTFENQAAEQREAFRSELAECRAGAADDRRAFRDELREERSVIKDLTDSIGRLKEWIHGQ